MKSAVGTGKTAISKREKTTVDWKGYVLLVRPTNLRINSPRLTAREWWTERSGAHKLPSGRVVKDYEFRGASLVLGISRRTSSLSGGLALKAIARTRKSGTLTFDMPDVGSWSSALLEMLGIDGPLSSSSEFGLADVLASGNDRSAAEIASRFLGMFGLDARSLANRVFDGSGEFNILSGSLGSTGSF